MSGTGICAWCEGPNHPDRDSHIRLCCSIKCARDWMHHGASVSRRQVEERRAHIASQPKGCATIEAWLAAGGKIYREDHAQAPSLGFVVPGGVG